MSQKRIEARDRSTTDFKGADTQQPVFGVYGETSPQDIATFQARYVQAALERGVPKTRTLNTLGISEIPSFEPTTNSTEPKTIVDLRPQK